MKPSVHPVRVVAVYFEVALVWMHVSGWSTSIHWFGFTHARNVLQLKCGNWGPLRELLINILLMQSKALTTAHQMKSSSPAPCCFYSYVVITEALVVKIKMRKI